MSETLWLTFLTALTHHSRAPSESSLGSLGEVIHSRGSAVRHLEVGVDVDAARDHHLPIGLDGLHPARHDQVVADLPVDVKIADNCEGLLLLVLEKSNEYESDLGDVCTFKLK